MPKKPKKPKMLKKPKQGASKATLENWLKKQQENEKAYLKAVSEYEAAKKTAEKVKNYKPKI